jgi:putative glycosyltransferase (TIGR04372 family)
LGPLRSERIGHFIADTEIYLSECELGMHGRNYVDIFYHTKPVSNRQLKKMWDRKLLVFGMARFVDFANRLIPGGKQHVIPMRCDQCRDNFGVLGLTGPHLVFTPDEEKSGRLALAEMGINSGKEFICFHTRDAAYLESVLPATDWSYHRYRDADIKDFLPAVEKLADRGYAMVRMGARVKDALPTQHGGIIDYARNGRSEFLDIYLTSRCRFFLGTSTGISNVPMMFRRPVVCVNVLPYGSIDVFTNRDIVIPKKIWIKREKRFASFQEIFASEIAHFGQAHLYADKGLEVIDNTPEEICEAAEEMNAVLEGKKIYDEEDERLQEQFRSLFQGSSKAKRLFPRIGSAFLRNNKGLLVQEYYNVAS